MAQQKEVLIIGASRGIGLAVAQAFAGEGWQVTATHRSGIPEQVTGQTFTGIRWI